MLYPENIEFKTGFNEVRASIRECCLSPMGKRLCDRMRFITAYEEIELLLKQTEEFRNILQSDTPFPSENYLELRILAAGIKTEGSFLSEEQLLELLLSIRTIFAILSYLRNRLENLPLLNALAAEISPEPSLVKSITAVIDDAGKLRPDASALYAELSRKITSLERDARRSVDHKFREAQKAGWSGDGNLTVRDGRLCIPILAEHKRKMRGFIHDESATGQTVYLEPEEVFSINNQVRDLEFDKRREKVRILKEVADCLRLYYPLILDYDHFLSQIDFIRAKAVYAGMIGAILPHLHNGTSCKLIFARHPVLDLNLKKHGSTMIPLDLWLDPGQRIILVSGPNAGGKSVCLKTLGILQLMLQHGILVSADPASSFGIFRNIFVDIGDDQSIESDLSTYSAHLTNMKLFVEKGRSDTLILIDEFGTGTDPVFGGPIAEAVLEVLNQKKVFGVVTTHYSNLKVFAGHEEGIVNASMLFDNENMRPLYRLEIGKPGSSYAFEIAHKIGLPPRVIEMARNKISEEQRRVDNLLVSLERDKTEIIKQQVEVQKAQRKLDFLMDENQKLKGFLDENRTKLISEAKKEAEAILKSANRLVESTIHEIKQNNAEKAPTKEIRQKLTQELSKLNHENKALITKPLIQDGSETIESFKAGDWVKLEGQDSPVQILSLSKGNAVIALGDIRSVVKVSRIVKIEKKEVSKAARSSYLHQLSADNLSFSPELDLRGKRGEEAIYELERWLDRALMLNLGSLKIIHGKGDGILRKMVREYLKKVDSVEKIEDEHADRGGDGITYVYLN